MAALSSAEYVPLCTCAAGDDRSSLRLRSAGAEVLRGSKLAARKLALVGIIHVLDADADADADAHEAHEADRGLFLSASAASVAEQDAAMLVCVLRGVSLRQEPFWGSLLLLLSSHVVVASPGPISGTASFQTALPFLADFAQLQVLDGASAEQNSRLLRELAPHLTWGAVDLKLKDMQGCETPTKYLEQQLAAPPSRAAGSDAEAQLLLAALLPVRDCVVLKSSTFRAPDEAHSAVKLLSHAADRVECKPFFGRYLSGALVTKLARSLAHTLAASDGSSAAPVVLQRVVTNVLASHWQELVRSAFKSYCDLLHARLAVYERAPITGEYLVDVTERKLQASQSQTNQHMAEVNAGQGAFSAFDEFGNLKRQPAADAQANASGAEADTGGQPPAPLNTGLFSFLKNRGRAISKQFSLFPGGRKSGVATARGGGGDGGDLGHIPEDEEAETTTHTEQPATQTPDQLLERCTAPITRYSVPMEYLNTPSEAMPVDAATLDEVHAEGLEEVNAVLEPFLVGLRGPTPPLEELACPLDFHVGKKNLWRKLERVRGRFVRANEVSSAVFCAELLRYLHSVVLRKNETDTEAQQAQQTGRGRAVSSIMLLGDKKAGGKPVALTRVPLELMTYKTNLEAMVSQYRFVARGPQVSTVLAGFLSGPVRRQLQLLTEQEYDRFSAAGDEKERRVEELEEALESQQRQVQQITKTNVEWSRQEAEAVAEIELAHSGQVSAMQDALRQTDEQIERALADQQALYQSTMQATRRTIDTVDKVADKGRLVSGYLERYEKGHMFSSRWRQYFYVLDHATLTCYKSKSEYEERGPPFERPVSISGYSVVRSRTDDLKIKVVPPEAGRTMLRFRAPASVGRETWMKRFVEATQCSSR